MDPVDSHILGYLQGTDTECRPIELADALYYRSDYIEQRCMALAEQGLVQPVGHADTTYIIRGLGRAFLDEELPPRSLETSGSPRQ